MDDADNPGRPRLKRPRGRLTPEQLQERIDRFAALAGDLVPESTASYRLRHYGNQLIRCSSSAGGNYAEARSATTPRGFRHKLHECAGELRESMTWLNHIAHATKQPLTALRNECDELIAILVSSIVTATRNANPRRRKRPRKPRQQ